MTSPLLVSLTNVSIRIEIKVDQPAKGLLQMRRTGADGQIDRDRLAVEPLADFVERAEEIGPLAIHLVDQRDPRHAVLVGLMPNRFALGLDAFPALNTTTPPSSTRRLRSTSAVKSTWPGVSIRLISTSFQGNVTDAALIVMPAFLLLGIVVGDGRALIDRPDAVAEPAIEQHPLGDGGFARVDMGDDADVAKVMDVDGHGHGE